MDRFEIEWPAAPVGMADPEWQARLQLAACYRLVDLYGWTSVVYNHITLRIPGTEHLLINPFGMRYDEIRATDLIVIDIDGNPISQSDWPVNQAGYVIHSTVHRARPDLHCVLHTHEPFSQALCALQSEVIPLTQEGCQFYQRVGYHKFEGIVLDGSEAPHIVQALGQQHHTLVLKNHGLITAGSSPTWAFVRHHAFIRNAQVQLTAMTAGNISLIDPEVMEKTREQFEGGSAQAGAKERHPEWPALLRKIDQRDPTWKQ
jgi:ribulose-5-phosphate 4-epimerase/fuculose-1-phosphate aldolase